MSGLLECSKCGRRYFDYGKREMVCSILGCPVRPTESNSASHAAQVVDHQTGQIAYAAPSEKQELPAKLADKMAAHGLGEYDAPSEKANAENNFCRTCGCHFPPDEGEKACRAWEACRGAQEPRSPMPPSDVAKDAARYRRLRENWINCDELCLYGRLSVIDAAIDAVLDGGAKREGQDV